MLFDRFFETNYKPVFLFYFEKWGLANQLLAAVLKQVSDRSCFSLNSFFITFSFSWFFLYVSLSLSFFLLSPSLHFIFLCLLSLYLSLSLWFSLCSALSSFSFSYLSLVYFLFSLLHLNFSRLLFSFSLSSFTPFLSVCSFCLFQDNALEK